MREVLVSELVKLQKRLAGQKDILTQTKTALDAAIAAKLVALTVSVDARMKRQALAVAATQAAIVECEAGIADLDKSQLDMLEAARQENAEKAPSAPLKEVKPPHDARKR